jgi:hypothetical protein
MQIQLCPKNVKLCAPSSINGSTLMVRPLASLPVIDTLTYCTMLFMSVKSLIVEGEGVIKDTVTPKNL